MSASMRELSLAFSLEENMSPFNAMENSVVVLIIASLYIMYRKVKPHPIPASLPGPRRLPIVGILKYMIDRWDDWPMETVRLTKKYGKTWGGPMPNLPGMCGAIFYVVDEASTYHVLSKNFDNYEKGDSWRTLYSDLLGRGIFNADGDLWRAHRKIMSNMFSRNLLRKTAEVVVLKLEQIASIFNEAIADESKRGVDLQDIFFRMTFDVTSFIALGSKMDSVGTGSGQHPVAMAFDEIQKAVMDRYIDPFFHLKRWLQIGTRERRITTLKQTLSDYCNEVINKRRRSASDGSELGPDLLSRFIDYSNKNDTTIHDEELKDVVLNILIAGRDTTACALSWTFYELTKHPHMVEKIVQEAKDVCGTGNEADYSYNNISRLRYTHAVVMEALRLHPSVTNDMKFAIKDDTLPDGTFIPAGCPVLWNPFAMGRSERVWGEDAEEFKPERFLGSKEPSPFKYIVFNAGPRTCLGKPLAIMTIKLSLAYLLPRFQFVDNLGHPGDYQMTVVRTMKGGFEVDVSERS